MPDTTDDQLAKLEAEVSDLEKKLEKLTAAEEDVEKKDVKKKIKRVQLTKQDECDCDPDDEECQDECEDEMDKAKDKADCKDEDDMTDTWSENSEKTKKAVAKAEADAKAAEVAKQAKAAEDAKAAEVAKAAEAAKVAEVAKAAEEFVEIEGVKISKSDPHFTILKAQADRLAKAEVEITKAHEAREFAELRKQADDLYSHLPGTTDERAEMLKAVSKMPEAAQKQFTTVFTNAEKIAKAAFDTIGSNGGDMKKTAQAFEQKVSEIRKRDNCTRTEAMSKARMEDADAFAAYQSSN